MRPIDLSLNVMTTNVLLGMLLGLPIAALMQRKTKRIDS
jgi:ABC-type molybdate transport system permease subunit